MKIEEYCEDCHSRKNCLKPCKPVETWLRDGQSLVFEDKRGDITVIFPKYNEIRFSELPEGVTEDQSTVFADEAEKVIPVHPRQYRAKVFYERFFKQKPNNVLAKELGISMNYCSAVYVEARKRLLRIVEALDGRDYGLKHVEKSSKRFTDNEKWFLMNKMFGFSVAEIARMPGTPNYDALKQRLRRMHNKYNQQLEVS